MLMPENLDALIPGDVISFEDITQLASFEDMVAQHVDPNSTQLMNKAWAGRVAIKDIIRPLKFNGRVTDIELTVMEEPVERLLDSRERGKKFSKIGGMFTGLTENKEIQDSYKGYTFTANATSSGRGVIGQIQAELWYGRVITRESYYTHKLKSGEEVIYKYIQKANQLNGGSPIRRYVTIPEIEKTDFINLEETSRRIGFEVLRKNMLNPIVQSITQ